MDGILLVDKPKGWTSFDVVAKVRSLLRQQQIADSKKLTVKKVRVGHTGTLDPLATGLLILLIGSYTKKATELSKLDKTYEVSMKLGETSSTGDGEGEIRPFRHLDRSGEISRLARDDIKEPTSAQIEAALNKFVGEIMQTPSAFSAIKVGGQRAYKLARAGKEVKIEPRKCKIYKIALNFYEYPSVRFTAKVSSGTYIRSLVEDIGKAIGTGAYMSGLRRTQVGEFNIKDAHQINESSFLSHLLVA